MPHLDSLDSLDSIGLVDLLVLVVVVAAVIGALRRGRGLLSVLGAGLGAVLAAWLVLVAVAVWGPAGWADQVQHSAVVRTLPVPQHALDDLGGHPGPTGP